MAVTTIIGGDIVARATHGMFSVSSFLPGVMRRADVVAMATHGVLKISDMAYFPTLSSNPDADGFGQRPAADPTIRTDFQGGAMLSRPRITKAPRIWSFGYSDLLETDKLILEAYEQAVKYGTSEFFWRNPQDGNTYTVRFMDVLKWEYNNNNTGTWQTKVTLIESLV